MNYDRVATIARIRGITPTQKLVLLMLAIHEGEDGLCCPKVSLLAEECGVKRRFATEALRILRDKGFIRSKSTGRTNKYYFTLDNSKGSRSAPECNSEVHHSATLRCAPDCSSDEQYTAHLRSALECSSDEHYTAHRTISNKSTKKAQVINEGSSPTVNTVITVGGGASHDASKRKRNASKPPPGFSSVINKASGKFLRHGFEWMADLTPYKHPINEVYKDSGGNFINAWGPEDPDVIYDCDLTKEDIAAIRKSPIICALDITNEGGNKTTEKAFRNRLEWIGREHFVGEVARMYSDSKREGDHWNNPGQILIRRLDYVHAILVGTGNNTHDFNPKVLWDYALAA